MALVARRSQPLLGDAAIVIGASRGIGAEIAVALAAAGARGLVLLARSAAELGRVARRCEEVSPTVKVVCCPCDVTVKKDLEVAIAKCKSEFGGVSIAVLNVGVNRIESAAFGDVGVLEEVLHVNLVSCMRATRLLLPMLLEAAASDKRGATLVFISSMIALNTAVAPGHSAYIASKTGLSGFADGVFAEVRHSGVRVSSIYPGLVNTGMGTLFTDELGDIMNDQVKPSEILQPADIARTVVLVCTPRRAACFCDVTIQPQPELFHQDLIADGSKVRELLALKYGVPLPPAPMPAVTLPSVAIVTGAGRGIGRVISVRLAQLGFRVALIARTESDLVNVEAACRAVSPLPVDETNFLRCPMDICSNAALASMVTSVVARWGTVSTVVFNAGINRRCVTALSEPEVWLRVVETNLISAANLTRLALPYLIRHSLFTRAAAQTAGLDPPGASLIYVNSMASHTKSFFQAGISAYNTTKTGLLAFAETVLSEVRDFGVRVSSLQLGLVNTELGRKPIKKIAIVMEPDSMIQCEDVADCVEHVITSPSTACPTRIAVVPLMQFSPWMRDVAKDFMDKHAARETSVDTTVALMPPARL